MTAPAERAVTGVGSTRVNAVTMVLIAAQRRRLVAELASGGTLNGTSNWIFEHGVALSVLRPAASAPARTRSLPGVTSSASRTASGGASSRSVFLHYGLFHLAMNMYSLYFAGTILEQVIGRWRFVLLYLVAGLAGAAGALVLIAERATVGASGAIFGILGALFVLERRGDIATGGQIAGADRAQPRDHVRASRAHLGRRARRRPDRRHRADVAAAAVPPLVPDEPRRRDGDRRARRGDRVLKMRGYSG